MKKLCPISDSTITVTISLWRICSHIVNGLTGITANEYDKKVQELKKKERDIYEQLKDHSKADEEFLISSSYILELAHNGYSLFKSSQTSKKREILNFVFANFQADGSKLLYKTKEPFWELLFCAESWKWLPELDSNQWPTG